jgi:hypothetical protein
MVNCEKWSEEQRATFFSPKLAPPATQRFQVHGSQFTVKKKTVFQTTQNVSSVYLPLQTVNRELGTVNHIQQGLQLLLSNTFSCFL